MRKSLSSNANSVAAFVCKKERFDASHLKALRKTQDSIGRTAMLQAFATFDFLPMPDMYLLFFNCQRFAWVSWLFWYSLGWMLNSCWLQHTRIWQIAALAYSFYDRRHHVTSLAELDWQSWFIENPLQTVICQPSSWGKELLGLRSLSGRP